MKKHYNALSARDAIVSRANKLPESLWVDAVDAQGSFSIAFLLRLDEDGLASLNKEIAKKSNHPVFLEFSTIPQSSNTCPMELKDFSNFDWTKVIETRINGNTSPYATDIHNEPFEYVSVVFVMKD